MVIYYIVFYDIESGLFNGVLGCKECELDCPARSLVSDSHALPLADKDK